MADWQVKQMAGALGAEVIGPDLGAPTAEDWERIDALILEHKVLFFPGQKVSIEEHVALGEYPE